jgi:manganese/iron transport system permease protein
VPSVVRCDDARRLPAGPICVPLCEPVADPASLLPNLIAAAALAIACGSLSVLVVARRWAFLGEGIGHGGFGGAGAAWVLAVACPAVRAVDWLPAVGVVAFGLASALAVGWLSDRGRARADAAIGIVMVAGLAFGLFARQLYQWRYGVDPVGYNDVLFGQMAGLSVTYAASTAMLAAAVVLAIALLGKELVAYGFDPASARAAGVRVGLVHYTLLLLVTVTILLGIRLLGGPLVTALLVVPGTAALRAGRRLSTAFALSVAVAVAAAIAGVAAHARWRFVPTGPAVVLALLVELAVCYGATAWRGPSPT